MIIYFYLRIIIYFYFFIIVLYLYLTPQTIKVLLPFVAFVFFGFLTRNKAVWIYVVVAIVAIVAIIAIDGRGAIEERHYPSHHMSSEDDE